MSSDWTRAMDPATWPLIPATRKPSASFPSNIPFVDGIAVRLLKQPDRTVAVWEPGERERKEVAEAPQPDAVASPGVNAALKAMARHFELEDVGATSEEQAALHALLRRIIDALHRDGWAARGSAKIPQPFTGFAQSFMRGNQRLALLGSSAKGNSSVTAIATEQGK